MLKFQKIKEQRPLAMRWVASGVPGRSIDPDRLIGQSVTMQSEPQRWMWLWQGLQLGGHVGRLLLWHAPSSSLKEERTALPHCKSSSTHSPGTNIDLCMYASPKMKALNWKKPVACQTPASGATITQSQPRLPSTGRELLCHCNAVVFSFDFILPPGLVPLHGFPARSYPRPTTTYLLLLIMSTKAGFRLAPPTRNPSMSACLASSTQFFSLTLPP